MHQHCQEARFVCLTRRRCVEYYFFVQYMLLNSGSSASAADRGIRRLARRQTSPLLLCRPNDLFDPSRDNPICFSAMSSPNRESATSIATMETGYFSAFIDIRYLLTCFLGVYFVLCDEWDVGRLCVIQRQGMLLLSSPSLNECIEKFLVCYMGSPACRAHPALGPRARIN